MTTDTRPKLAPQRQSATARDRAHRHRQGRGDDPPGHGDDAGVIATDAFVAQPLLQQALWRMPPTAASTASRGRRHEHQRHGAPAGQRPGRQRGDRDADSAAYAAFAPLTDLCTELAQAIVRDGEGATRFVTIQINGAESDAAAHQAANTIATSPLVKTAFFGGDANWGRILAAVGRAGVAVEPAQREPLHRRRGGRRHTPLGELQLVAARRAA
jgi:glutamate N-acetyltransferase/amino-acid N-acetyltransferase